MIQKTFEIFTTSRTEKKCNSFYPFKFSEEKYVGVIIGHEVSGTVEQLADDLDPNICGLKVGDKVVAVPWLGCRKCSFCKAGDSNLCPNNVGAHNDFGEGLHVEGVSTGGYAAFCVIPDANFALKVPDAIPMDVAATLMCGGITAYTALTSVVHGIHYASRHFEKPSLLVIGMGGLGTWATLLARHVFNPLQIKIICADNNPIKRQLSLDIGADEFILIKNDMPKNQKIESIRALGGGGINVAIDFVGSSETMDMGFHCLQNGGIMHCVGLHGGAFPLSIPKTVAGGLTVQGSRTGTLEATKELLELVSSAGIKFPTTEKYKLEEINHVHDRLRRGEIKCRAVIDYNNRAD